LDSGDASCGRSNPARATLAHTARIETNSALTEAMTLYTSAGWNEVDAFNAEPFADRWLQKSLAQ
jgi:hypothetical protein